MARCRSGSRSARERAERRCQAGAHRRTLREPHAAPGVVEDLAQDARIGGRRVPHRTLAREEDERHAAPDHLLAELFREVARRSQPIRFDVARRHALRDVDREDDVHAEPARRTRAQIDVWTGERDDEAGERDDNEDRLQPPADAAARDQSCRASERPQRADTRAVRERDQSHEERQRGEEQQQLGPREAHDRQGHGVLRNTREREKELKREQSRARRGERQRRVLRRDEGARADPRLLQRLDLAIDVSKRGLVGRAEVQAAGRLGHALHQRLIDLRARARRDGADRVQAHADQLRDLRRIRRLHVTRVVLAVGQEDRDLSARRGLTHDVESRREPGADRRTVTQRPSRRDGLHQTLRRRVVERERAEHHRLSAEDDDADAIVLESAQEVVHDLLHDVDAGLPIEIRRRHRRRRVDDDHDVDPLSGNVERGLHDGRGRERDDQRRCGKDSQRQ